MRKTICTLVLLTGCTAGIISCVSETQYERPPIELPSSIVDLRNGYFCDSGALPILKSQARMNILSRKVPVDSQIMRTGYLIIDEPTLLEVCKQADTDGNKYVTIKEAEEN